MSNETQSTNAAWVAVLEIAGLQKSEYDAIVKRMGVEQEPAADIYLHVAAPMNEDGIRVIELWKDAEGFQSFIQSRMLPAAEALRRAQLKLRETRPDPFYWAAFALFGD